MGIYIEIALSLMLVFLIISLVVTAINELITIQLRKRPAMLLRTITALIDDPDLRQEFYANGIVVSAKKASAGETVAITDRDHPSYIDGRNFAKALTMAALKRAGNGGPLTLFTIADVQNSVSLLPASKIRDVLVAALSSASQTIDDFERQLAAWYDTTQDRLTGEFARNQRWVTLVVGGILVILLNADAIQITRELQTNDALRDQLVGQANALAKSGIEAACANAEDADREGCLVRETRELLGKIDPVLVGWQDDAAGTMLYDAVHAHLAPASASAQPTAAPHGGAQPAAAPDGAFEVWFNKIIGLAITILAVSLGAPFWFDLLSKVVNIRGAGVKPEKTEAKTEAPA